MLFKLVHVLLSVLLTATPSFAADCGGTPGQPNGECVQVCAGSGCNQVQTSYRPTCEGNCYVFPFGSLDVSGDGFFGTNCLAYSDTNCQNYIGETGNTKSRHCTTFGGGNIGQSMKCYYRC